MDDLVKFDIRNWRRDTRDRVKWREFINRHVACRPVQRNINETIYQYKVSADRRRSEEAAKTGGSKKHKRVVCVPKVSEDIQTARNNRTCEIMCGQLVQEEQDSRLLQGVKTNHIRYRW